MQCEYVWVLRKVYLLIKIPQEQVYSENAEKLHTEYKLQLVTRIFIHSGFGGNVGKWQASTDSLAASQFSRFPPWLCRKISREAARRQGGCIASSDNEGPFMLCLCLCIARFYPKAPIHFVCHTSARGSQILRSFWGSHVIAAIT
jgi:hypothetical protein